MGVTETRYAELQLLTPDGAPAVNEHFGLRPQEIIVELGADGVWSNLATVETKVWLVDYLLAYLHTPHMGFGPTPGDKPWVRVGGYSLTIEGFEPMLGSLNRVMVVNWEDLLRFRPGDFQVVAESLHEISAA